LNHGQDWVMLALSDCRLAFTTQRFARSCAKEAGNGPVGKTLFPNRRFNFMQLDRGGDHKLSSFAAPILSFAECQKRCALSQSDYLPPIAWMKERSISSSREIFLLIRPVSASCSMTWGITFSAICPLSGNESRYSS
jgi:hypothetical protein